MKELIKLELKAEDLAYQVSIREDNCVKQEHQDAVTTIVTIWLEAYLPQRIMKELSQCGIKYESKISRRLFAYNPEGKYVTLPLKNLEDAKAKIQTKDFEEKIWYALIDIADAVRKDMQKHNDKILTELIHQEWATDLDDYLQNLEQPVVELVRVARNNINTLEVKIRQMRQTIRDVQQDITILLSSEKSLITEKLGTHALHHVQNAKGLSIDSLVTFNAETQSGVFQCRE